MIPFSFNTCCLACADDSAAISTPSVDDVEDQVLNNSQGRESIFAVIALTLRPLHDPAIKHRYDTIEINLVLGDVRQPLLLVSFGVHFASCALAIIVTRW